MYIFDIVTVHPNTFLGFTHKILKTESAEKRKGT